MMTSTMSPERCAEDAAAKISAPIDEKDILDCFALPVNYMVYQLFVLCIVVSDVYPVWP